MLTIGAAIAGVVLGFVVVGALVGLVRGAGAPSEEEVRAQLVAAGCTLQSVKAQPGRTDFLSALSAFVV